jgi:hypothetical protein
MSDRGTFCATTRTAAQVCSGPALAAVLAFGLLLLSTP